MKKGKLAAAESLLAVNHRLTQANREEESLPFEIIDRIFALPPSEQPEFLKETALGLAETADLTPLRDKVTNRLFRHRGKELKTIVEQEKARRAS